MPRYLVRMNAVIGHEHGSFTDGYAMEVATTDPEAAVREVRADLNRSLNEDETGRIISAMPWVWELGADGRPIDQGQPAGGRRE